VEGAGASRWTAALVVTGLAHLLAPFAVHLLGRRLLGSSRAAAVAALFYCLNPGFVYFDTEFAYESLAITFVLWTVALGVVAVTARSRRGRVAATAAGVPVALACVVTHHLSTLFLVVILTVVTVCSAAARLRTAAPARPAPWAVLLAATVGGAVLWVMTAARDTLGYLSPYAGPALFQLLHQAHGGGGGRTLYSLSVQPGYERAAGLAVQALLAALFLVALRLFWPHRREWRRHPVALGLVGFGLLYYPSVLFILSPRGAEGARRSWDFTFLGLAVLAAATVDRLLNGAPGLRAAPGPRRERRTASRRLAAALVPVTMLLAMGNIADGLNDAYRFPGPFQFGSDSRSLTPELRALVERFGGTLGPQKAITDRYTGLAAVTYGQVFTASPSAGFPAWELVTSPEEPSAALARMISSSHYDYLIVDRRLADLVPAVGTYFEPDEPAELDSAGGGFVSQAALDRLDRVPWATSVLVSDRYAVYRLSLGGRR
jgi:hypothetical protein